jgi:Holliday junction resolvase RusA-like endonuclease
MSDILFQVTIPGRAYVKKNGASMVGNGKFKKLIYTPQYQAWEKTAILQVRQKRIQSTISFPINLKVIFYFDNRMAEADLSALYEGIQDVLQSEGVIANDRLIVGHNGSTKVFGEGEPRMEVEITAKG